MKHIIPVTHVSIWDEGVTIHTRATYNQETLMLLDIEMRKDIKKEVNTLQKEYILLPNGEKRHMRTYERRSQAQ